MTDTQLLVLVCYTVGTLTGIIISFTFSNKFIADLTIRKLIEFGYVRSRTNEEGQVELIKVTKGSDD